MNDAHTEHVMSLALDRQLVERLLNVGRADRRDAFDALLDELAAREQPEAMESLLTRVPWLDAGVTRAAVESGESPLDDLGRLKSVSKRGLASESTGTDRHAATLAYLIAVAAAASHHRTRLGTTDGHRLHGCLTELASYAPTPLRGVFEHAADFYGSERPAER